MKHIRRLLVALSALLGSSYLYAEPDEGILSFEERFEQAKVLLGSQVRPVLGSIVDLAHLEAVQVCQQRLFNADEQYQAKNFHAIVLRHPDFMTVAFFHNSNQDLTKNRKSSPLLAECDVSLDLQQVYLIFGDEASPLMQEYEKYLKPK